MARCPVANCVGMLEEKVPYIHITIQLPLINWHLLERYSQPVFTTFTTDYPCSLVGLKESLSSLVFLISISRLNGGEKKWVPRSSSPWLLQPASQGFVHAHTLLATGLAISPSCPLSQKSLDLDPPFLFFPFIMRLLSINYQGIVNS